MWGIVLPWDLSWKLVTIFEIVSPEREAGGSHLYQYFLTGSRLFICIKKKLDEIVCPV